MHAGHGFNKLKQRSLSLTSDFGILIKTPVCDYLLGVSAKATLSSQYSSTFRRIHLLDRVAVLFIYSKLIIKL